MMHRDDRFFKPYNQPSSSSSRFSNMSASSSSYYGMHYPSHTITQSDLSGSLDFSQFPAGVESLMTSSPTTHTMPNPIPAHSSNNMSTLPTDSLSPDSSNNPPTTLSLSHNHHSSSGSPTMDVLDVLNSHSSSPIDDKTSIKKKETDFNTNTELSSPSSTTSNHSSQHDSNNAECDGEGDNNMPPKKRQNSSQDSQRDSAYWEKRKKNNESAKRSREARRMKEEQIALRVVYLEQENLQLRTEVSLLKGEIEKLRCMLYNP